MAKQVTVVVRIDAEKAISQLQPIIENIERLHDMVPDYLSHESDKLEEELYNQINGLIKIGK